MYNMMGYITYIAGAAETDHLEMILRGVVEGA